MLVDPRPFPIASCPGDMLAPIRSDLSPSAFGRPGGALVHVQFENTCEACGPGLFYYVQRFRNPAPHLKLLVSQFEGCDRPENVAHEYLPHLVPKRELIGPAIILVHGLFRDRVDLNFLKVGSENIDGAGQLVT